MDMHSLFQADLLLQVRGITSGRAAALVPAVLGLLSVGIGWWTLARRSSLVRRLGILSLVLGLTSMVLSGMHLARATGAIGTGSGRLGAIVALVLGLIGTVLGWLALARSRRNASGSST
jgi:hypothetical protein